MAETAYKPPQYLTDREVTPDPGYLLDWYLARYREAHDHWEQEENARTWRASSLGNCLRAQTLERRGIPTPRHFDEKTIRTFAWGDNVHTWFRKVFWRLGLVIAEEPVLEAPYLNCVGHADLIWTPCGHSQPNDEEVRAGWSEDWNTFLDATRLLFAQEMEGLYGTDPVPYGPYGMELKSAHSYAMKRIFAEGPNDHHKVQAAAYKLMSRLTPIDANRERWPGLDLGTVDRWFITYVGKDAVGVLNYEVEDAWVDEAQSRLGALNAHWASGRLPMCTCKDWQVNYCAYNEGDTCCGRNMRGQVARALRKGEKSA